MALSWNLTNEDFLLNQTTISQLKLRASYGAVGNQAIRPYQSLGIAQEYNYLFNVGGSNVSSSGYSPNYQLANPDLKWETTRTLNFGLDFGFWNGRLTGTAEYFLSYTEDLLIRRSIGGITGYTQMLDNLGKVENQGIELSLNTVLIDTKDADVHLVPISQATEIRLKSLKEIWMEMVKKMM